MRNAAAAVSLPVFHGRLGVLQRVLPGYRAPFFEALAAACEQGLSIFAGQPLPGEAITSIDRLKTARVFWGRNWHIGRVESLFYLCWQSGILGWLEGWQPDALVVEANPRYLSTPLAVIWMRRRGRPVLGWGLGVGSTTRHPGWLEAFSRWRRRRFLRQFDALIAYSRRGAQQYAALGFPEQRIFVALNAVAGRPATPPERPPTFAGRPAVLFVGRLQPRKRIDLLLRACAALPEAMQPRLWIVGDGPDRQRLRELAEQLYPSAEFPGELRGADLQPYFVQADLFVLPGTGGLAVQQAMAYGLPVIVAEGDGTQDDLVRPENGWRIPPGDLPALTAVLQQALTDPLRLRRMGAASYRIAADEVNIEAMASVFVRALNQLMPAAPSDRQPA